MDTYEQKASAKNVLEAKERGLLLSHSIAMENYKNHAEKVGVRQFLSRLQMLFQEPIVVVILFEIQIEELNPREHYLILYHTMLDPLWKPHFERRLEDKELNGFTYGDNFFLPRETCKNKIFKIHDKYHAMFFKMNLDDADVMKPPPFELFNECSDNVSLSEFLKHFKKNSNLYHALVTDGLSSEFDKRSSQKYWAQGKVILREPYVDLSYNFGLESVSAQTLKTFYDESFKKISVIIDECYERIRGSSLLKLNNFQPPNMMFAVRFFENTQKRFSGTNNHDPLYSYSVRGILPKQQKSDIKHSLEVLRRIQKDKKFKQFWRSNNESTFYFPKPSCRNKHYEDLNDKDFPLGGNSHFKGDSDFFWDLICSDCDLELIIDELEKPYGLSARALSDIVFSGGFVRVAPEPYVKARGVRLDYSLYMKGKNALDFRRNVYYHYIQTMAAAGGGGMSSLLVPGAVNGTPWLSMGYHFTSGQDEQERWLNCYHFYHSVSRSFIRGVRTRLRFLYLEELKTIYEQAVRVELPQSYPELGLEYYPDLVNPYLKLLCRVYPYDLVQLEFIPNEILLEAKVNSSPPTQQAVHKLVVNGVIYQFWVYATPNPYFESYTRVNYHSLQSVVSKLNEVSWQPSN